MGGEIMTCALCGKPEKNHHPPKEVISFICSDCTLSLVSMPPNEIVETYVDAAKKGHIHICNALRNFVHKNVRAQCEQYFPTKIKGRKASKKR
jgi:hypothetical protein